MSHPPLRRLYATCASALLLAGCSSGSASDPSTSGVVTVTTASSGSAFPNATGFAYFVPAPRGSNVSQALAIAFTSEASASCGSDDVVRLLDFNTDDNQLAPGVQGVVIEAFASTGDVVAGQYPWENYGGAAEAYFVGASCDAGSASAGVYGGQLVIDTITSSAVSGSFRLDVDSPATTGTFSVPLCGQLPPVSNPNATFACPSH
jgi:hypothetical protein